MNESNIDFFLIQNNFYTHTLIWDIDRPSYKGSRKQMQNKLTELRRKLKEENNTITKIFHMESRNKRIAVLLKMIRDVIT